VIPPASAGEIKDVTGDTYSFRGTLFTMGAEVGERLMTHLTVVSVADADCDD
jgi:hypothetical protein